MKDKTLTFDEVWDLINTLDLPGMNCGPGETDKEGIILHDRIGRDELFVRELGDQVKGFDLVTVIKAIADWNYAVGKQKGKEELQFELRKIIGARS